MVRTRGDLVLVQRSIWSMRNQVRGTCASHRTVDLVGLACACLLLGTWFVFKVDAALVQQTAFVRVHGSVLGVVAAGLAVVAGATAGWKAYGRGLGHAFAPWVAVLPMARATRSRAVTLVALAAMPWRAALAGLIAGWVGTRTGGEAPGLYALTFVAVFSGAFVAVVIGRQRRRSRAAVPTVAPLRGAAPQAGGWLNWVHWLRGIDSARPRWISAWECGEHARRQTLAVLAAFAVLGGASTAASFAQGWSAPALGVGVVGGNLVFVSVLRGAPLRSPVCGTAPLGFVAAWAALIRLPLVLSLAWFGPLAGLGAVAQHGGPSAVAASTLALLGGDLIYAVLVAFSPASPVFTMTLYAGCSPRRRERRWSWDSQRCLYTRLSWRSFGGSAGGGTAVVNDPRGEAAVLRTASITAGYTRLPVISDVTFHVRPGECLGLLGANGAGKSTLLGALTGQLALHAGEVRIDGVDLGKFPEEAKRRFGYAVEGTSLPVTLTGGQYLELVASIRGCHPRHWPFGDVIEPLGLRKWLREQIGSCSLGTRTKLSIAAALLDTPPLIILDESLNGLDPVAAWQAKRMIAAIVRTGRHGVVLATHVLETIASVCNCALFLEDGRISHRWSGQDLALAARRPDGFEGLVMDALHRSDTRSGQ